MFIIIIGTRCAGKSTIEDYLASKKGFRILQFPPDYDSTQTTPVRPDGPSHVATAPASPTEPGRNDDRLDAALNLKRLQKTDSFVSNASSTTTASTASSQPQVQALWMQDRAYMLDYVTRNWQTDFVTMALDGTRPEILAEFARRPFCAILHVDAPVLVRWERAREKARKERTRAPTLDEFVAEDDTLVFGRSDDRADAGDRFIPEVYENVPLPPAPGTGALRVRTAPALRPSLNASSHLVSLRISNGYTTKRALFAHLDALDIVRPDRLRPTWDDYFMMLAELAARRSNCMKRRVGAILVRGKRIIATGYNGTAVRTTNCVDGGCNACNLRRVAGEEKLNECICLHAEENALLEAGRDRVSGWGDEATTLYCNTCPCLRCSVKIVQTGVREVVYNHSYKVDEASAKLFREAGVVLRRHVPPPSVHQ